MRFPWVAMLVCGINIAHADECTVKGDQDGRSSRIDVSMPKIAITLDPSLLRLKHDELLFRGNTNECYRLATNFLADCMAVSGEQSLRMAPSTHLAEIQTVNHFASGVFQFQMDRQTLLRISGLVGRIKDYCADEGTLVRYIFKNAISDDKTERTSQDEEETDLWQLYQAVNDTVISLRHLIRPFLAEDTEEQLNGTLQLMSELSKEDLFADELFMASVRSQLSSIHRKRLLEKDAIELKRRKTEAVQALEDSLSNERASTSSTVDTLPIGSPFSSTEDSHDR